MAFISYEEYKQRRTNGESASSIVRESFGNQSTAGQGFPDFEEYQRLRNSGQSARDIVSQYLQPKQETQKITRHDTEAPVTRRASSAPIIPEIEQRRQSTREAAGTARDQARQNLESLKSERAEIGGYIYDDFTAAMYADKIAELDRQIAEASKNYKAKDQEYKDVYAGYNAARKELQQAQYNYSQALNEYRGEEDDQRVKDAETRLANARTAFENQGGNPDASVVSAGLKGSAAGVVDTFGYLQELGQPENEKSWGIFTTGHMTEAQKHHQEVLAQREKEKYEAEHGAGTYTETPAYLRTQDTAAKLARESAEEINSMKAGRGEIGQIAVDLGVQGVQMGADAIAGKVLPGGSLTAMALRTFGSSVREARDEGANIYQQGLYGAGSAAVEVLTEKMFDGLAGVYGAGVADDIVSHMIGKITDNRLGQAALEWAADALGEGLEEVASDTVNPLLRTIYNDMSVGESYRENLDWQEVGYDFLIGALMGFAGGSVENVANITGATAPDERADFFMQAGQSGMSFKDAMNTWHKHMIKEGYATQTSDQEITNQANEYLNRLESGKRVSERKINKLNQRATNTIAQEDIANTVTGVQQRMQQFGINDPKLAQAIAAVALENEAERIGAKGVGATEAQRKMVEDSSIAKRILSEMDVENMRREQAADYFNRFAEMGGASDEELQRNIEPYQRTNEWVKNLKGNKALASDVYGTQNIVTEAEKNAVTINGESVKIVGAENGKVTIEQNGERQTVDAGKLENMSDSYKQLVSYAPAGQSGEAFLRLYKSSQDVAAYAKAWDLAENMYGAQTNVSFDEARQRSSLKVLTDAQLQMALDIGRERYNANKAKAEERGKQLKQAREEAKKRGAEQRKKGTVSYDGGEVNGVKYKGIDKSKLSVAQKRVVAMVEALADAVNIDYVLFEGEANTGGSYIQGGTVYINIKAGEYSGKTLGAATLSHELTHFLQDFAPEEYQELKDFLIAEIIKQSPAQFEKLVQKQLMLEPNLNYDRATDEMIANACQKMLLNSEAVTKLARQNMNLAEKIRDAISEISDKIKAAFEDVDMSDNVPVFEAARSIENVMDKAQALWDKALEAASENYNAAQATGMKAEGGVQNMLIGVREDGIEVYETSPEIKRLPWKEKRKKFLDIMSNEYRGRTAKFFRNGHTYYARFEDVDAQKTIFGDNDSDQTGRDAKTNLGADGDIFTLVENAEWFGGEVERGKPGKAHKDVKYWDYYLKTVQIDGRVFDLLVNVRQKVGDSFVYSLELFERKDVKAASPRSFSEEKRSPGVPTASNQIIADESEKSNTEIDAGDTAFEYDAETESVNEQHQLLTWEASDYVTERNKAAKEIADKLGISQKKAKDYIDSVNSVAKYIAENKVRLDYEDTGRSPFVGNVEYGGSFDFTTLCKKRRLLTGTFSAIQQALANTALTANEILEIRKMMDDAGLEVSCGKCYVEGSRASMGIFTKEFLKLYEKYNPGAWVPNMAQMNTPDGIEWVRVNHPEVYEQYEYFWNHYGTLRPGDPNLFASQQKPKLYQMRSAYKGEVLKHFKNDGSIQEKNRNGGLRMQSFSDFEIVHLLDAMQVIMDMSRVGLNGQAYTKVPDFAWALGKTGLKINLSIDAWDVVDGKLVFNNKEGMNFNEAMRIRDANSKNVGTICCVYDDAQLLAALADPRIDFIIPFHRSQWKKSQYKGMGLPATTKDYTYQQNEKWLNPSAHTHEYRGRQVKDKCTNYMPNEYWDFSKSGKENAEEYLRMCARDGKRPKFYKFLTNNGDGSYSLKADGSTDGYWKLLIDFKMYDNEGNGSPQMPVKPDFNMEEIRRMLESYEGGHNSFPVAHGVVNQFVDKYKSEHPGQQFQKLGVEYNEAVENNDMDKASHLVNQAAKEAGAILNKSGRGALHLYHGTPSFGFTEFHPGMIFLTDNKSIAAGYTQNKGYGRVRQISEVYTPDDGTTKTLIKNLKNVLGQNYREVTGADVDEIRKAFRTSSGEMSEKVNDVWDGKAMDALHAILGDEYTQEFENKLYEILALPGYINEWINEIFENPTSETAEDIKRELERHDEYLNDVQDVISKHNKELRDSDAKDLRALIMGYDLSDFLIDAQYKMAKAMDAENMLMSAIGSLVSKERLRQDVEQTKDVGAYDLYGFAGDNPLEIDGNGAFWTNIEVPELGGVFMTDEIGRKAKEQGYTSVIIHNIMDSSMNEYATNIHSDVYIFFDSEQVKSADPVTYDEDGNVIPLDERFNLAEEDIRYQKLGDETKVNRDNLAYHAGDLGKAEHLNIQGRSRGTGHFGTGTYFVGVEEKVTKDSHYGKRPQHAVDFSDYNLYKVRNDRDGYRLHDALRIIDGGIKEEWISPAIDGEFNIVNPIGYYDLARSKYGEDWAHGDNLLNAIREYAKENGIDVKSLEEYKAEEGKGIDDEDLKYYYEDYVKDTVKKKIDRINEEYQEFRDAVFNLNLLTGLKDAKIYSALKAVADYQNATPRNARTDSYATVFMKNMGYDGVDVRNTGLDNTAYGSVIYDVKPETVAYQKLGSLEEVNAEISRVSDQIRNIQNAQWRARDAVKSDPRVQEAQEKLWAAEDKKGRIGALAERREYNRIYKEVQEELQQEIPEGDLNELAQRVNELKEMREQFIKVTPITREQYDELANHFGTTDDYAVAGFILPDGRMLDFSGKKQYGRQYAGGREVYHNEVGDVLDLKTDTSPRIEMVSNGNIRLVPEVNGINLSQKPTAQQKEALRGFIEYHNGDIHVDIDNLAGRTLESFGYYNGASASKILADIDNYFRTGEAPKPQSIYRSFYQKLGIGETAEEQEARKESFDNLKAENKILRARAEYWKAQTRPTKERTVRQQDTNRLANELLKKYESRADKAEVKDALKELGDWLVQTEELDYDELRTKAEAIAEDIISGNYALLDNSQQENLDRLKDYLKSTPVNLTQADFRDTGDEGFRKKYGRYFTVRENGRTIDSLWGEMAAMFGEGVFPEDVYAPGDMLNMIADYLDMWKPQYGNEFEMFHDEAVNAATNEIIDAILSEDVRQTPGTFADKAQQKLNSQIAKDKEKLDALRAAKNARIEELKRQASEKNAQIRLAEKAAKYEAVSKVKKHYQDMLKRQRNKRGDTAMRAKIKKLHKELSDILLKPKEGRYVPRELVKATAEILGAVDTTSGRAVKAKAAMAELKVKYDALAKDQKYALTYDETVSGMLQSLVEELGDGNIYDLTGTQLEAMYNVLKSLKHTIVTANKLVGAKIEADAFEAANEMMHETESAKGIPNKLLRRFALAQMTPSSAFRAFGGYKKNSMWEQMFNELNNGQLTQTQILMEGGQLFRELIDDKKNMAKLHDQKNLVDIGLKDDQGNAIKVTRGMMLSVYMHLLNEQNARHVAYGGLTVPRLKQYYKNQMKDAFNGKTGRAVAFATEIAELNEQLKTAETVEEQEAIKERLAELNDETDAYMSNLRSTIEDQLTDYDRKWIAAAQEFFDVYSKGKLNEVTEMVYGFEKAQVDNYFPIHTDPDYRAASFDTIVRDMNLENAGFMKERVNGANPILLEDITDVISSQLRRTAQYVGLMPAIRNFNKVYGKARAGYSMSVQSAMARTFESEGKKYIENLMADLNGARKTEANIFDELRGNMAGAVLTLNPRVTLAQAASFPSAAAEIGYKPLMKAITDMKNPMWDKGLQEEIAKWTPLWWYRMQGFSTTELGDIKNNEQFMAKVMDKMKWATGWIQAADGLTTGGLWQASKYYVNDNFSDLEKGSDEYMMKVAEIYNRVLEKTQPDYTTMQRPDILRNPNAIVKQLTMFMTQRLQNTNILYDAAATYSHYVRDLDAGRNGVTAADVKQAKTRLVWAVSSQVAAGATIVIFKAIADAIMHNLKAYRDDDDELTAESVSKTMLTNFVETLSGNILWGSEVFSWMKSAITGERYYGVSLNGVDTFTDMLEDGNKMIQGYLKGNTESGNKAAWKLAKAVAQFFGIPLANAEKVEKMTVNYIEDARNGTWYESDVDRTKAQNTHILFDALQRGDTAKAARIRQEFKNKKDEQSALKSYIQELYTGKDQKIQKAETVKLLQQYAGMTKREAEDLAQKWTMEVVTGIKFSELQDKYIAGEIPKAKAEKYYKDYSSNGRTTEAEAKAKVLEWTCEKETGIAYSDIGTEVKTGRLAKEKAIQMVMKYGGKDRDAATKIVNGYLIEHEYDLKPSELEDEYMAGNVSDSDALDILRQYRYYGKENAETKAQEELERLKFVKANPDAEDISLAQVRNYNAAGLEGVVDASTYAEAAKMMGTFHGVDADGNGKTDPYSIIIQKLEYIDTLDLDAEQKTRLAQALGISDKNIRRRAPWR